MYSKKTVLATQLILITFTCTFYSKSMSSEIEDAKNTPYVDKFINHIKTEGINVGAPLQDECKDNGSKAGFLLKSYQCDIGKSPFEFSDGVSLLLFPLDNKVYQISSMLPNFYPSKEFREQVNIFFMNSDFKRVDSKSTSSEGLHYVKYANKELELEVSSGTSGYIFLHMVTRGDDRKLLGYAGCLFENATDLGFKLALLQSKKDQWSSRKTEVFKGIAGNKIAKNCKGKYPDVKAIKNNSVRKIYQNHLTPDETKNPLLKLIIEEELDEISKNF